MSQGFLGALTLALFLSLPVAASAFDFNTLKKSGMEALDKALNEESRETVPTPKTPNEPAHNAQSGEPSITKPNAESQKAEQKRIERQKREEAQRLEQERRETERERNRLAEEEENRAWMEKIDERHRREAEERKRQASERNAAITSSEIYRFMTEHHLDTRDKTLTFQRGVDNLGLSLTEYMACAETGFPNAKVSFLGDRFEVSNVWVSDEQSEPINFTFYLDVSQRSAFITKVRMNDMTDDSRKSKFFALTQLCRR